MPLDIDSYINSASRLKKSQKSILRIYGLTPEGHSLLLHIHGYHPHLLCECLNSTVTPALADQVQTLLNSLPKCKNAVNRIEILSTASPYSEHPLSYSLKILTTLPSHIPSIRAAIHKGALQNLIKSARTSESYLPFPLQFLTSQGLSGNTWLYIRENHYSPRRQILKTSTAQIEADVDFAEIQAFDSYQEAPSLRVLSFDIECSCDGITFPEPETNEVIQIGNICKILGKPEIVSVCVFTLGGCAKIPEGEVHCFRSEYELIKAWGEYFIDLDPDVVTGFNINCFDFHYLMQRARVLGIKDFGCLGRIIGNITDLRKITFKSKGQGFKEGKEVVMSGRIVVDMYQFIHEEYFFYKYSLNSVSTAFLNDCKKDVPYTSLKELQSGSDDSRKEIAVYCLKDCELPLRLLEKLTTVEGTSTLKFYSGSRIKELKAKYEEKDIALSDIQNTVSVGNSDRYRKKPKSFRFLHGRSK